MASSRSNLILLLSFSPSAAVHDVHELNFYDMNPRTIVGSLNDIESNRDSLAGEGDLHALAGYSDFVRRFASLNSKSSTLGLQLCLLSLDASGLSPALYTALTAAEIRGVA